MGYINCLLLFNVFVIFFIAPPINRRTWKAPERAVTCDNLNEILSDRHIVAEVLKHTVII